MKTRWLAVAAVAIAFSVLLAPTRVVPAWAQMGQTPPLDQLSGDEFDKAFLREMTMHHAMAVEMARPVVANASHQELRDLAQSIVDDQMREIAQMRAWAKDWYGLDIPDHVAMMDQMMAPGHGMPGMGDGGMGMPMHPGMPMNQMHGMSMMESLRKLPPQRLEAVFMSQMIPHHQGAIDMANLVPDRASHQELKDLARDINSSQGDEISTMNGWLASWYSL